MSLEESQQSNQQSRLNKAPNGAATELSPEEREAVIAQLDAQHKSATQFIVTLAIGTIICYFSFIVLKGQKIWTSNTFLIANFVMLAILIAIGCRLCSKLTPILEQLEELKKNRSPQD